MMHTNDDLCLWVYCRRFVMTDVPARWCTDQVDGSSVDDVTAEVIYIGEDVTLYQPTNVQSIAAYRCSSELYSVDENCLSAGIPRVVMITSHAIGVSLTGSLLRCQRRTRRSVVDDSANEDLINSIVSRILRTDVVWLIPLSLFWTITRMLMIDEHRTVELCCESRRYACDRYERRCRIELEFVSSCSHLQDRTLRNVSCTWPESVYYVIWICSLDWIWKQSTSCLINLFCVCIVAYCWLLWLFICRF